MGIGGSRLLPVSQVLEAVARHEREKGESVPVTDQIVPADDALPDELKALGVDIMETPMPEARRCWSFVSHQDFWRTHHAWHPKKGRVKMWLFVHEKYRAYSASMLQAAESMQSSFASGDDVLKAESAVKDVESSFRSLTSKIETHSEFEDTQLFRFFKENVPEVQDEIKDLEADHSDKQLEEKAFSLLKSLREQPTSASETAVEAVSALKSYAAGLEEHLEKEERALVSRWLNLNPDLYAKYRTYLTGKYRLVY